MNSSYELTILKLTILKIISFECLFNYLKKFQQKDILEYETSNIIC